MKVKLNAVTQPRVNEEGQITHQGRYLLPEEYMIYCARVSSPENRLNHETAPKLLKYLIDAGHWSPFEMVSAAFEIETSRAIAQQILRHRSFSFQEFSQRYAKVDAMEPVQLRKQAEKNRQSSTDPITDPVLHNMVKDHLDASRHLYDKLIEEGAAKECARMVLPLTTQTTIVMHGTLRSWIHFLAQRADSHAQQEIQDIAYEIQDKLCEIFPWTARAIGWWDEEA